MYGTNGHADDMFASLESRFPPVTPATEYVDADQYDDEPGAAEMAKVEPVAVATNRTRRKSATRREPNALANGELEDTDAYFARLFVEEHGDAARYCHPWNAWLQWRTNRWEVDESGGMERAVASMAKSCLQRAVKAKNTDERRTWIKRAESFENAKRIETTLKLARGMLAIMPSEMDRDPWLFNAANGTIDLRTGELKPHCKADYITKVGGCDFESAATPELFEQSLADIFQDNNDLIDYLWRLFGRMLSGDVSEHLLTVFWGTGANGKSLLIGLLLHILGDYGYKANADLLLQRKGNEHPTEIAALFGKRAVFAVETGEGRRLNESLCKELTGGDRVTARRMRENYWTFDPCFKLVLCTNHRPTVQGTDHGIWRRLRLIPFGRVFKEHEQDKRLGDKLRLEAPAILGWLVRGCLDWQQSGLAAPAIVMDATKEYRATEDILGAFLNEHCVQGGNDYRVRANELYQRFRDWVRDNGERELSQRQFGLRVADRAGIERLQSNGTWYVGVALR